MTQTSIGRGMGMGNMGMDTMGMNNLGMGTVPGMMGGMMPMIGMPMMGGMMNNPMAMAMPQMSGSMMGGMMMAPRCKMTMAKMDDGMSVNCMCEDQTAAMMMQNLCMMMQSGMCSMCCCRNGMCTCCCNMGTMGLCKMEMMDMGCKMTCTSGDPQMMKMIQSCCDCMTAMIGGGCMCCMMLNGVPICCSMTM